jgi:hypothetical protein
VCSALSIVRSAPFSQVRYLLASVGNRCGPGRLGAPLIAPRMRRVLCCACQQHAAERLPAIYHLHVVSSMASNRCSWPGMQLGSSESGSRDTCWSASHNGGGVQEGLTACCIRCCFSAEYSGSLSPGFVVLCGVDAGACCPRSGGARHGRSRQCARGSLSGRCGRWEERMWFMLHTEACVGSSWAHSSVRMPPCRSRVLF